MARLSRPTAAVGLLLLLAGAASAKPQPAGARQKAAAGASSVTTAAAAASSNAAAPASSAAPAASAVSTFEVRQSPSPDGVKRMTTDELRASFLIEKVFVPGQIVLTYTDLDRMVIGGASPLAPTAADGAAAAPLALSLNASSAAAKVVGKGAFLARRELGVINISPGRGAVVAGGQRYELGPLDALYVPSGTPEVTFESLDAGKPAKLYLVSTPCTARHSPSLVSLRDANVLRPGAPETANVRSLYQMLVPGKAETCQLMLGATLMANGSVWNTMPAHTHARRSEAYLYFGLPDAARVFHFLGEPAETRHIVVANEQAALSPPWSIHAGAGTTNYGFVWAMAGENEEFSDMVPAPIATLR